MIRSTKTIRLNGVKPVPVLCESNISDGVGIHIVGLADASVKESLLRTVTAMQSLGFRIPGKKIIINLLPANLLKEGSGYDLAISLAILAASGQKDLPDLEDYIVLGELTLDGRLRRTCGAVQAAEAALKTEGCRGCIIPKENLCEVATLFGKDAPVYPVETLMEAIEVIEGRRRITAWEMNQGTHQPSVTRTCQEWDYLPAAARRAVEIAAAGGHGILLMGNPNSGKGAAVKALVSLLPDLTPQERLETAEVYSAAGRDIEPSTRPLRTPFFTSSLSTLLGGGKNIIPGEVSLAHNGVLFLDELQYFPKGLMEALRGPIEERKVTLIRLRNKTEMPAGFQLAAAVPPCPCGHYGNGDRCTCPPSHREAFLSKLPVIILDHISIQCFLNEPEPASKAEYPFDDARQRICNARKIQKERYTGTIYNTNDEILSKDLDRYIHLGEEQKELIEKIITNLSLSARSYSRILRIARTIADLEGKKEIENQHLCEAASYRFLDRKI